MQAIIKSALHLQRQAWNNGHENYGASIDVKAEALKVLEGFKHLNPVQKALEVELTLTDELKFAKPLSVTARKAIRHFVVSLK